MNMSCICDVPPTRAAEYGVPIFRLTSSGISQFVSSSGRVVGETTYPGQGETISATLDMTGVAHVPGGGSGAGTGL